MPFSTEQLKEDQFILMSYDGAIVSGAAAITKYFIAPIACTIVAAQFFSAGTGASALVKRGSTTLLTLPQISSGTTPLNVTSAEASTTLNVDAGETLNAVMTNVTAGTSFVTVWAKRRLI